MNQLLAIPSTLMTLNPEVKTFGLSFWKKQAREAGLQGEDIIAFAKQALTKQNTALVGGIATLQAEGFSAVKGVRKTLASGKEVVDFRLEKACEPKTRKASPSKLRERAQALLAEAEELEKTIELV